MLAREMLPCYLMQINPVLAVDQIETDSLKADLLIYVKCLIVFLVRRFSSIGDLIVFLFLTVISW